MPVNLKAPARLSPIRGVRLASTALGVREQPRDDLTLIAVQPGATVVAAFTRNQFCAAPVTIARDSLARATPRVLVVNAGNANAGTGLEGLESARRVCGQVAARAGCEVGEVLPFSTGVVGEPLDTVPFEAAIDRAWEGLDEDGWRAASAAIMTTDTTPKGDSREFSLAGRTCTVTGIAKGSGMICPNMATMLAFVATDAAVAPAVLQSCLDEALASTFNCISVDGDTSTNDACVLLATGAAGGAALDTTDGEDYAALREAVTGVCRELAHAIVRDGEGATKFVTLRVTGGRATEECARVAYTVAHSPLVKTAFFASDANWGRILAAVGRAGVEGLDIERVRMWLGDVQIVEHGGRASAYRESQGAAVMLRPEIAVRIDLGRGDAEATVWTCDLSHDYVTINAEYRT